MKTKKTSPMCNCFEYANEHPLRRCRRVMSRADFDYFVIISDTAYRARPEVIAFWQAFFEGMVRRIYR